MPSQDTRKVLFFTKGEKPTAAETAQIARIRGKVHIRNASLPTVYGVDHLEACEVVAGAVPAAYAAKADVTPVATDATAVEAFKVFPPTCTLGVGATMQLRAVVAKLNEATDVVALTDEAADAGTTYVSADITKCTVNATGLITRVAAGGPTNVTATRTAVAAVKASLDCGAIDTCEQGYDSIIEATTAGVTANDYTLALVADGVAKAGTIEQATAGNFVVHFLPGTSTVGDVDALITALAGGDDLIGIKTGGTAATVLHAADAFQAHHLSGGAAAVTATSTCAVTTT